ncbi:MAG TPA: DUF3017 domain-containing protein [Microlunatus sp.]|nr:DUF3017 domain-containing protein [Microlunatus sp.]
MIEAEVEQTRPSADRSVNPWALVLVLAGVLAGLGYAVFAGENSWRIGCVIIGAALGLGALLRLVLPKAVAGLLVVRSRPFDVLFLGAGGAVIIVLAILVPGGR